MQAVWLVLRLLQTYEGHSGFDFSDTWAGKLGLMSCDSAHHDHHHTANVRLRFPLNRSTLAVCPCWTAHHLTWRMICERAQMGNFGALHTDWLFGTMDHYIKDGMHDGYVAKRRAASKSD